MTPARGNGRDVPLEGLRGLAALSVVAFHLLMAFQPDALPAGGAWWYGPFNGPAAVILFFVLSGYVLTRQALVRGEARGLWRGVLKRYPRLAGPILLSVLLSWALLELGLMAHEAAGRLSGSDWLVNFTNDPAIGTPEPSLPGALLQGGAFAMLRAAPGDAAYNSVLWTMRVELIGSFLAFGLGLALVALRGTPLLLRFALLAATALAVRMVAGYYLTFIIGVGLALLAASRPLRVPGPVAAGMAAVALWMLGYVDGGADHALLALLYGRPPPSIYVHAAAAALLILAIEGSAPLRAVLSGGWAAALGRLSFPIYLLHLPVLCSAGALAFVAEGGGLQGTLAAVVATLGVTLALAWPLARLDGWWTGRLNALAAWLLPAPRPQPAPMRAPPAWPGVPEGGMGAGWVPEGGTGAGRVPEGRSAAWLAADSRPFARA